MKIRALSLVACTLVLSCGVDVGEEIEIGETESAATTASLVPIANGTPTKWANDWDELEESTCDNGSSYVTSDAAEDECWEVSLGSIGTGAEMFEVQLTPCAAKVFSGTSHLKLGYKFGTDAIDWGNTYNLTSVSFSTLSASIFDSTTSPLPKEKTSGLQLYICAQDTDGNGINLSKIAAVVKYVAVPTGLTLTTAHETGAKTSLLADVCWTNSTDNNGYKVQKSADGSSWSDVGTVGTNVTCMNDISITPSQGVAPRFRVAAFRGSSLTAYSSAISGLPSPAGLATHWEGNGASGACVTWGAVSGATTYMVQVKPVGGSYNAGTSVSAPTIERCENGVDSSFRLWAENANHQSILSSEIHYAEPPETCSTPFAYSECGGASCDFDSVQFTGSCDPNDTRWGYSVNGGANWFEIDQEDLTVDERTQGTQGIMYRAYRVYLGTQSEFRAEFDGLVRPSGFGCSPTGGGQYSCSWNAVSGADNYIVFGYNGVNYSVWYSGSNNFVSIFNPVGTFFVVARLTGLNDSIPSTTIILP